MDANKKECALCKSEEHLRAVLVWGDDECMHLYCFVCSTCSEKHLDIATEDE